MKRDTSQVPTQIRFFELELQSNGKRIELAIDRAGWTDCKDQSEIAQALAKAVKSKKFENEGKPTYDSKGPGGQERLGISLMSPIACGGANEANVCMYVIRLGQRGNNDPRWRFATEHGPFSTADDAPSVDLGKFWSNAAYIDGSNGSVIYPGGAAPDTQWACFVFDHGAASGHFGGEYLLRYNTHVELLDNKTNLYIPVVIDPDVGWPGGGGPP